MAFKFRFIYLVFPVLAGLFVLYWQFDPREWDFFPKCPFYHFTGLQCSGCGLQRAIHSLLHLDFPEAFRQHALLPLAIPYVLFGVFLDFKKNLTPTLLKWRKLLFGRAAIKLIFTVIILFTIVRNLF